MLIFNSLLICMLVTRVSKKTLSPLRVLACHGIQLGNKQILVQTCRDGLIANRYVDMDMDLLDLPHDFACNVRFPPQFHRHMPGVITAQTFDTRPPFLTLKWFLQ